jgi:hypothetical protein
MIEISYNGRPQTVTMSQLATLAKKWPGRVFARYNRKLALAIQDARERRRLDEIKTSAGWVDARDLEDVYTA